MNLIDTCKGKESIKALISGHHNNRKDKLLLCGYIFISHMNRNIYIEITFNFHVYVGHIVRFHSFAKCMLLIILLLFKSSKTHDTHIYILSIQIHGAKTQMIISSTIAYTRSRHDRSALLERMHTCINFKIGQSRKICSNIYKRFALFNWLLQWTLFDCMTHGHALQHGIIDSIGSVAT